MNPPHPNREDSRETGTPPAKPLREILDEIRDFLRESYPAAEYAAITVVLPGRVPNAVFPVIGHGS